MDFEAMQQLEWKEAVQVEGKATLVREVYDGWWLFEKDPNMGGYNGILGWDYTYGPKHRYFVVYDPAKVVEINLARFGYAEDKNKSFTDGRQVKWVTRSFLPPVAREYAKMAIQQLGVLDQSEIDELERLHNKLEGLLRSGSLEHKAAMKVAKKNREALKKKWSGCKQLKQHAERPPMPENVSATLNMLNGHPR